MSEHFTGATISAAAWCNKCKRQTQHAVGADHKIAHCLECFFRTETQRAGLETSTLRDGQPAVRCNEVTFAYLSRKLAGEDLSYRAPLLCSCPQREYPHDLSVHTLIRSEWWARDKRDRWPWSLMHSRREEPSTERKAAA